MKRRLCLLLLILWGVGAAAQEIAVPVRAQYLLFLKILTFDRNLDQRVNGDLVIGIVYQRRFRRSLHVRDALLNAVKESKIADVAGHQIRVVSIDLESNTDIRKAIREHRVNALYIAPLRAVDIKSISKVSREAKVLTMTGVPEYVEEGIAVGIGLRGEKPEILVNLRAAKAEGVDFHAQLLKLAKVFR